MGEEAQSALSANATILQDADVRLIQGHLMSEELRRSIISLLVSAVPKSVQDYLVAQGSLLPFKSRFLWEEKTIKF